MADFRVVVNGAAVQRVGQEVATREVRLRGNRVLNAARRNVSVDTGRLRASLTMTIVQTPDGPVARIGSNLAYARYEEEGTGIYAGRGPITPKRGKFLAWPAVNNSGSGKRRYSGGQTSMYIFAKSVRGRPGTHFLTRALDAAR